MRLPLLLLFLLTAFPLGATGIATSAGDVPFVLGALSVPPEENNNRGILEQQSVPGLTHVEICVNWRYLEPARDQWRWSELDEWVTRSRERGLKVLILPVETFAPAWFQKSSDYSTLVNMADGSTVDFLSPWAPGTRAAYDHFFDALARHYSHGEIDCVDLDYPGSDFGEVGLTIGGKGFLPGGGLYADFPQNPATWKNGYWCGDAYARADFQKWARQKYGGLDAINAAWGTTFDSLDHLAYPDPKQKMSQLRRWVDFITWLQQSQSANLVDYLRIVRRHFPGVLLNVPMGFGSDQASLACDRTGVPMAVRDLNPIVIRSTHAGFNRGRWPLAYWFYKRMAPVARALGEGFGIEPPGGDLTAAEMRRVIFEDASAGTDFVYQYYQNFHAFPGVIDAYKSALRPQEKPLVDIGVLFPSTEMMIDDRAFPPGQIEFCDAGREFFDYDLVDENMIGWDMLKNYRVLLHTGGDIFREGTLPALDRWLNQGGIIITRGTPQWRDIAGGNQVAAGWRAHADTGAPSTDPRVQVFDVGQGRVYAVNAPGKDDYLPVVVNLLAKINQAAPLHGFDGQDDGHYITDFPDGRLVFDERTLATTFVPK